MRSVVEHSIIHRGPDDDGCLVDIITPVILNFDEQDFIIAQGIFNYAFIEKLVSVTFIRERIIHSRCGRFTVFRNGLHSIMNSYI